MVSFFYNLIIMDDKKKITFSIYKFIINNSTFSVKDFDSIKESTDSENIIGEDLVAIDKITKKVYEDRFICFSFYLYERWPYSEKVLSKIENKIIEENNPRSDDKIELKDQIFVVLDSEKQRIYLSNRQKENHLKDFLKKHNIIDYTIKPIFNEKDFIDNIKSVQEIALTVENTNIFNQIDSLSKNLSNDIYGYGADEATLYLRYKKNKNVNSIKSKLNDILNNRSSYKNITIVGRNSGNFEKIFNLDGIIERISITTTLSNTKEINVEDLLSSLILNIRKYDKTK